MGRGRPVWAQSGAAVLLALLLLPSAFQRVVCSDEDSSQQQACRVANSNAQQGSEGDGDSEQAWCNVVQPEVQVAPELLGHESGPGEAPIAVHATLPDPSQQQQQQQQEVTSAASTGSGAGRASQQEHVEGSLSLEAATEAEARVSAPRSALATSAATPALRQQQPEQLQQDLQRLQGLLQAARQAVSELSLEVSQQEDRLRALYGLNVGAQVQAGGAGFSPPHHPHQGWLSHFQLVSTLQTHSRATVVHAFGQPSDDSSVWELPRYVTVGDAGGKVYFCSAVGHWVLEYDTGSTSPITAMASYSVRRNESVLVTGHEDGEVRTHGVYEVYNITTRQLHLTTIYLNHVLAPGLGPTNITTGLRVEEPPVAIKHLIAYRALGKKSGRRLVAVWDANGWLRVQRDDGSVKYAAHARTPPHIVHVSGELMVGVSSTDAIVLRTSLTSVPRSIECVGLNGSSILAAAFDPARNFRAYAWTDTGDMLSLVIPHSSRTSVCKASRRVHVGGGAPGLPTASSAVLVGLRGHLLALRDRPPTLHTFNTTTVVREGTVPVASSALQEVAAALGLGFHSAGSESNAGEAAAGTGGGGTGGEDSWLIKDAQPIFTLVGASDLLALSLGGNNLVLLKTTLPVPPGLEGGPHKRGWTQVVFIFLMGAVAVFQFTKARSQRHGAYGTSASRLRADFGTPGMPGLSGGRGGGVGGLRDTAAARLAAYHEAMQGLDRAQRGGGGFPSRAMRRAARMAPVSTQLHERPGAIIEEEELEEEYSD